MPEIRRYAVTQVTTVQVTANTEQDALEIGQLAIASGDEKSTLPGKDRFGYSNGHPVVQTVTVERRQ